MPHRSRASSVLLKAAARQSVACRDEIKWPRLRANSSSALEISNITFSPAATDYETARRGVEASAIEAF
jgi:hypothetical protein